MRAASEAARDWLSLMPYSSLRRTAMLWGMLLLAGRAAHAKRENIVLILTDDQDIELNQMLGSPLGPMEKTKQRMQEQGAFGTHAYVNVPICCPSRANILSGKMAHNIRDQHYEPFPRDSSSPAGIKGAGSCGDEPVEYFNTHNRVLPCGCMRMNISSYGRFESTTYANLLTRAGYTTAYFGKYLNPPAIVKYCRNETLGALTGGWPAGWSVFYGMCDQASTPEGAYYDVNWVDSEAGRITHTGTAPEDYTTSVIGNKTSDWIRQHGKARQPFMAVAATRAPHAPYLPPKWYADTFASVGSPRGYGSYNASCVGKPPWMSVNTPLDTKAEAHFDEVMRRRWGALLAVDDLVEGVYVRPHSFHSHCWTPLWAVISARIRPPPPLCAFCVGGARERRSAAKYLCVCDERCQPIMSAPLIPPCC